jgi:hypothetical protein
MKIELLTSRAAADGAQNRGDVIDLPDGEAQRMIEVGQAKPVRAAVPEKALPRRKSEKASK